MHRSVSPAFSETAVDISKSLFQDDASDDSNSDNAIKAGVGLLGGLDNREQTDDGDEAFITATQAAANRRNGTKTSKKAGAFQTMGLNAHLLKAITRKGFTVPTPIQRQAIPPILDGQDVVGMAKTGSGKTAAFVIPMIEKLKSHSVKVGARAILLSPTRELAYQTLKVVKDLGKGADLRCVLLVGGESLEDHFSSMASNPDIVIATPGRFEHVKIEMNLNLSSVQYVVFDEADRLFEMGFKAQIDGIIGSLPAHRQTLLFSATLPEILSEFAQAELKDPRFVRLDAESKIPPGLESAFFTVKRSEKEGALLHILQDVIKLPTGSSDLSNRKRDQTDTGSKKRKRHGGEPDRKDAQSAKSTLIFAATKYQVEYLTSLLRAFGYSTSYVYGTLDQTARELQVQDFRSGSTNILVVTDVAARGLDIPVIVNVINYDFPPQPKIFIHRVGRTARAGRSGWSYNLLTANDLPYLLDLQLFLSRDLILGRTDKNEGIFKDSIVVGALGRDALDTCLEDVTKLLDNDDDLMALREVAGRGEQQYLRSRSDASAQSVKRAKTLERDGNLKALNMLFDVNNDAESEKARAAMLTRVSGFRPQETVFEIGRRGAASEAADVMRRRRNRIEPKHRNISDVDHVGEIESEDEARKQRRAAPDGPAQAVDIGSDEELVLIGPHTGSEDDPEDESELTSRLEAKSSRNSQWQDSEHFMGYAPTGFNPSQERGYGVHSGSNSNFAEAARSATMNLTNDETKAFGEPSRAKGLRWDKKSKKYVSRANDEDGSKGKKMITSENGQRIAASFRSGRFDSWRKANKVDRLPGVGETERKASYIANDSAPRYKHRIEKAPKEADKYRDDYHKRKKRVGEAKEKRIGRFAEGKGKNELKGIEDVRKARKLKARRREKNARPRRKT